MNTCSFLLSVILALLYISGCSVYSFRTFLRNPVSSAFITGQHYRNRLLRQGRVDVKLGDTDTDPEESNKYNNDKAKHSGDDERKISEELSELISRECEISKNNNSTVDLSKYDWFDDEPFDSSDEEFAREYWETRPPDMETIYKHLDPYGVRYFTPQNRNANRFLGRVYGVGKPIRDDGDDKFSNVYSAEEFMSKFPNSQAYGTPDNLNKKPKPTISQDHDAKFIRNEISEFDFGDEFDEDDESIVMEDELCRYFLRLPLIDWVDDEKEAYEMGMIRMKKSKNYSKQQRDKYTADFRSVFASTPCSSVGVFDIDTADSPETVVINPQKLYIKEYKHNDLLNDIDNYESKPYPSIVETIAKRDCNEPIFFIGEKDRHEYSKDNKTKFGVKDSNYARELEDPLVYVGIPKSFIKPDERDSKIVNNAVLLRRKYDETVGKVIGKIPIEDGYNTGIILIHNEADFLDQNIRYLADELSVISNSFIFVPRLPNDDMMFTLALNRLIKFVQLVYKVDRLGFVALGSHGHRIIDYIYNAMKETISDMHVPKDEGKDSDRISLSRLRDLISRQSIPILDDILEYIKNSSLRTSELAARKARDVNIVKPLSKILQAVALFDTGNIDFKKILDLSLPFLILQSNRSELFHSMLPLDDPEFTEKRKNYRHHPQLKGMDVFKFIKGEPPKSLQKMIDDGMKFVYLPNEYTLDRGIEQYLISSRHKGVDTLMRVYLNASCHYYMNKPSASKTERDATGHSISSCAGWLQDWLY
ncbi:conserved hypothetical protein [Theileria equi strain WA]|uniref:Signal peptide-containing protein n=1 Tax=Theileria equi strain WA TaxID=1537102 RepID=L1LCS4_THEEQ|nr:conserved hypothetical protein [Theileria equi strain WA]EKX73141.1 conserved hypothetical protein [Theileria equi strain WA]|eukprot:XP_004832593.1 conserved hypothetical protein [Theileria equi strain WA]